ncbi:MAG: DUF4389 domain-containing protein [Pseudomonadota bacterium]|nr:DUF4389 domain-containing protein [Pseudomonadota bacterium]
MSNESQSRFSDPDLWIRLLYMILFALLTGLSRLVICVLALLQFLAVLFTGEDNRSLRDFSASLAEWTLRAFNFVTFNSDEKPFPFADWPGPKVEETPEGEGSHGVGSDIPVLTPEPGDQGDSKS